MNPPQQGMYKPLQGDLFPDTYPFQDPDYVSDPYFYTKYFVSQNNMFSIPKQMIYANYEVLTQALATNIIDFSQADIYELQNQEMTE